MWGISSLGGRKATSFLIAVLLAAPGLAEDRVAPPDALELRRIPPVPSALASSLDRYTHLRSARFASWHPQEREMLIATRFADTSQVHRVRTPGGARAQLTFYPEPVVQASFDPRTGDSFVFTRDRGGDEFYQLYRFDLGSGSDLLLSDGEKRHAPGDWSRKGDLYAFEKVDANADGAFTEIWIARPADFEGGRRVATLDGGGWGILDWSTDDRRLLLQESRSVSDSRLWMLDLATGEVGRLTPEPEGESTAAWQGGEVSADGRTVYTTTDAEGEFRALVALDADSGRWRSLSGAHRWDVSSFALAPDGASIAFVTNERGFGVLHLVDTATGAPLPLPELPAGVISGLEWHPRGGELAFNHSHARSPGDVYSVDVAQRAVHRWTYSEAGGLDLDSFVEPEIVEWPSWDGRTITGLLYRPPAERFPGPRPVIVDIHGGPEGQSRPGFLGRDAYFLQELGIALIYPNVRGSTGFGKSFAALDNGFLREGSYRDIETLFDWIDEQADLDPERIMVTGGSYGGHMTFAVASRYSDRIRCSVAVVGISNLRTFLENTQGYRRDLRRVEYGDERDPEMYAFLERIAPLNHADDIRKPILIVHGRNDPRVPVSESDQIVETVHENGIPSWYLVADDEGHGFRKKPNADYQLYVTALFVERFLLDGMPPRGATGG